MDALETWLREERSRLSRSASVAKPIDYLLKRWDRFVRFLEPEAWLTDVIARIGAHPINRLAELLPWNWSPPATRSVAA